MVAFLDLVDEVDADAAQRLGERAEGAAAHLAGRVEVELAVACRGQCGQEPGGGGAVAAEHAGLRDGRSLWAPLDPPLSRCPIQPVAECGEALGEAGGVIGVQRLAQHRGATGRGREEQRAGGDGLGPWDFEDGHADRAYGSTACAGLTALSMEWIFVPPRTVRLSGGYQDAERVPGGIGEHIQRLGLIV